ncbi:hypothetical protein [Endozoicomonas lisbonensis]|uniref:Uncharacterized protein n=1 Tax=Endozoicomonas lisbonensis TaxID=3120522 RepID=A0ABV2SI28_9GAMM
MMFVFKIGKEKNSSKNFNNHKRPEKKSNYLHAPVSEQRTDNQFYKKRGFFSSAFFSLFLIPSYATAFLGGAFNASDLDTSGIGGLDLGNTATIIAEVYGNKNSTGYIEPPIYFNGSYICADGTGSCLNRTAINTAHGSDKSLDPNSTLIHNNNKAHTISNFSCSKLKNPDSRTLCENFTDSKGSYSVRYLGKNELFWEHDSFTVYILPPGEIWFNDVIRITNAENVAIIGEADADGNYPTLRGSKTDSTMLEWINCQNCMLANVNIDPTTNNAHSLAFQVSGENTEIEFRNIHATHSRRGLLYATSAKSITLENVGTSFEPENRFTNPSVLYESAITLHNCSKIKAKNVWVFDVTLSSAVLNVIDILNPEEIDFDGISIGLTNNWWSSQDMAYIGLAFSDMEKNSRTGGSAVNALMKGLHPGVYTGDKTREHVTVPEEWPVNRHILSLSTRAGSPADTTKITGQVTIEDNDYIRQIANKPGVQIVSGDDLFYNLKVIFPGLISPTVNVSTSNSPFIPNYTSSPSVQRRKGDDDSGLSGGEIAGIAIGTAIGVALTILGYKYRAAIWTTFAGIFSATANVAYQSSFTAGTNDDDEEAMIGKVYDPDMSVPK